MKLGISRCAAMPAAFVAISTRVFLDLGLDGGTIHNGVWIAALLGALPAIPYLLCLDAVGSTRKPGIIIRWLLTPVLLTIVVTDAARVLSIVSRAAGYLTLERVPALWLILPVTLAMLWCVWRNGDAIGYAATLWTRVFPALMLVVLLLQARHLRMEWLHPLLGDGWQAIFGDGVRASGCFVPATALLLACRDTDNHAARPFGLAWLCLAPAVSALLLILRLMMAPTGLNGMPWLERLDALLTNGRAPLYLQLPMITAFFTGLMHLLACECFAAAALLQRCFPGLNGRVCAVLVVLSCTVMLLLNAPGAGMLPWLFVAAAPVVALAALIRPAAVGGGRSCAD